MASPERLLFEQTSSCLFFFSSQRRTILERSCFFLEEHLVTLPLLLQGATKRGQRWLCLVCQHEGAPAQDVSSQQTAVRSENCQGLVQLSKSPQMSKLRRCVALASERSSDTGTNLKHTSWHRHTQNAYSLMATTYTTKSGASSVG